MNIIKPRINNNIEKSEQLEIEENQVQDIRKLIKQVK